MSKPAFKVVDYNGRVLIPKTLRTSLGIDKGDIVGMTVEGGRISVKKAIIVADDNMPIEAKESYVQAVVREFDNKSLADLMGLTARIIQERQRDAGPNVRTAETEES